MTPSNPSPGNSSEDNFPHVEDNGVDYFPWEDPDDKGIDWSQVVIEYEPANEPVGDVSDYSDIRDVSEIRDSQEYKDELL